MSFRDLDGNQGARHVPKQQPNQRRSEEERDSSHERGIRVGVQELQDTVRKAVSQLDQAHKGRLSRRSAETLERLLERAEELSEDTARQFRDWTVHLAGEPAERHRKKFSFEKLQKAFDEEVAHLKDVSRRVALAKEEALSCAQGPGGDGSGGSGGAPSGARECYSMVDEQDDDVETGLLDDANVSILAPEDDTTLRIRATVAQEREEGIRRIQNQVSEVNQMFRDLASIVTEQGQQFESIERQAEAAAANTKQAVKELRKAVDRQRGLRERLCCMLAVVVFLLCFVILPHMHSLHPTLDHSVSSGALQPDDGATPAAALLLDTRKQPVVASSATALNGIGVSGSSRSPPSAAPA